MPYAGLLIGSQLVKLQDISHGDSKIFSTLGILGSYYPMAIGLLTEKKEPTYYAGSFMLGATAGFVAAHYLVKGYDFSSSAGFNIGLAAFAGGLLGAGIGRLMSEGYKSTLTGSILGSALGFSVGYASETIDANKENTKDTGFNFNFNPYSLTNMFIDKSKRNIPFYNNPILNISYSF